jgi:hypothetical protein
MDQLKIIRDIFDRRRQKVLRDAETMAREMVKKAKQIEQAVAEGDLQKLVWLTRQYNQVLATELDSVHEDIHLLEGLENAK